MMLGSTKHPEGIPLHPVQRHARRRVLVLQFTVTSLLLYAAISCYYSLTSHARSPVSTTFQEAQQCTIDNLHSDLSFLDPAVPISAGEFLERRDRLAHALVASNVDAFVLEPGYTFQYYGNISQVDWEPWEPEERPFLMVILPHVSSSGQVGAKTAFLSPHFEEGRVRMLGIPSREEDLDIVIWEEHWNPYDTLLKSHLFDGRQGKLMVDEEIFRDFIVRGLDAAGFQTVGLSPEVELVKQQKSSAEVELLRVVNTGTVVAVRAMRPCLLSGLTEDQVTEILNSALLSINFGLFFNIVLFEEHGALPHGGFVTGWKKLTPESMVVIDVGAHYLGYSSDICRSFFIDPPKPQALTLIGSLLKAWMNGPREEEGLSDASELRAEKLKVWDIVLEAQSAAAAAFKPNNTAASVDIAARQVIENAGYGYGFTHRLGHGIGIKAHESPYLNKWNKDVLLQPGMTFTNEPGIYLENRFGVRHEDIYLVKESGEAELLTGRRATGPYDP
ncbi:metallopeptidase family M24 [Colletotrichum orchidophilum]|uniref:Metallopeptidase family M24 n=1 Tax=Colletotrichum orchidophilum TaxID=1209926 RepID=A0A1G4BFI9_9PEZI|nr:metallopeptidase family M24 [Colletotrichum orchidophilum]OHF00077.1 metallopeptidase family M24 [Colletotrichum orchidophilum]